MFSRSLIAIPVMVVLTIVQIVVLPRFLFFPVDPSIPFLFALAWSLLSNVEEGLIWAFIGGLLMDIFTIAPFGGLALTYVTAVFAVNYIRDLLPPNRFVVPVISVVVGTTIQQLFYILYLRLFGILANTTLVMLLQTVMVQAILIIPIYWSMYFLKQTIRPKPVQI
ncbi:MAG: rod shape-determining protein MreD [Candidatus Promineifilaceae bacterium]|jgi:rod shape-determining protein MreD